MNIIVPIKPVPDLVEELVIDDSGTSLDLEWLSMILNEFDDHALEQALLLKTRHDCQVMVVAQEAEGMDDALFTAVAKGADRTLKLSGDFASGLNNHALARAFAPVVKELQPDLVLIGVQAHNDLDGSLGPLLAEILGLPYVGYVAGVTLSDGHAVVRKEYPGGLIAEVDLTLPAVLGIQAAEEPPHYVPVSKVRQAMKTHAIEELPVAALDYSGGPTVTRLYAPESGEQATMLEGDEEEVASKVVDLFKEAGVL